MNKNIETAFETFEKALRPEVSKEQLYAVVQALQDVIEDFLDDECDMEEEDSMESEDSGESENMPGMPSMPEMPEMEDKMDGQMYISEEERRMMAGMNKGLWGGAFSPDLEKRKFSSKQRERMASAGTAMPDGSYPIANKKDLMNAIRSWGRGGSDPKVKAHIKSRAKALGAEDMIPENWK